MTSDLALRVRLLLTSETLRYQHPAATRLAVECAHDLAEGWLDLKKVRRALWALDLSREPSLRVERAAILREMRGQQHKRDVEQPLETGRTPQEILKAMISDWKKKFPEIDLFLKRPYRWNKPEVDNIFRDVPAIMSPKTKPPTSVTCHALVRWPDGSFGNPSPDNLDQLQHSTKLEPVRNAADETIGYTKEHKNVLDVDYAALETEALRRAAETEAQRRATEPAVFKILHPEAGVSSAAAAATIRQRTNQPSFGPTTLTNFQESVLGELSGNWTEKRIALPVGSGKTLLSFLAPLHVPECRVAVLYCQPSEILHYENFYQREKEKGTRLPQLRTPNSNFIPDNYQVGDPILHLRSISHLSMSDGLDHLRAMDPDIVIVDESLSRPWVDARRQRIDQYVAERREQPKLLVWA